MTQKLVTDQTEITGFTKIDWRQRVWRETTLLTDRAVQIATANVHRIHILERAQHTFSREHMTAHSTAQVITGENSCVSSAAFHSHLAPQCLCCIVRSFVCSPHLRLHPQDHLRLPPQLQEVGATAQARPLAGVSLAGWLIQPQTQQELRLF